MPQLQSRAEGIAIVTGAASGMGESSARLMAEAGWKLLLCDLNAERLAQSAKAMGADDATLLAGDISASDFPQRLEAAIGGQPVGAVIHCAGLSPTMADAARILEVNLAATMRLTSTVLPHMSEGACAVLFASSAAHQIGTAMDDQISPVVTPEAVAGLAALCQDNPGMAYSVAKRGVYLWTKWIAHEFGAKGCRVASISPGIIATPMGKQEFEQQPVMKMLVEKSALPRQAHPDELGAVAVFLCSPLASFITGTDILVDGGSMARNPFA
jgi:NAD(P)-dependent dehydrogenase (short-subunit alcohol dehydrogenase family)